MEKKVSKNTFPNIQQVLARYPNEHNSNFGKAIHQFEKLKLAAVECQQKNSFGDLQVDPNLQEEFKTLRDCLAHSTVDCHKALEEFETLLFLYNACHSMKKQDSPIVVRRQTSREDKKVSKQVRKQESFRGNIKSVGSLKRLARQEETDVEPQEGTQYMKISMERYRSMEEREKRYMAEINNLKTRYFFLEEREQLHVAEVNDLKTRLSRMASRQLTTGNPMIADLSDINRPTKIGEKFGELYDEEWSDAFEDLQSLRYKEDEIIKILFDILLKAYDFCKRCSLTQLEELQDHMEYVIKHVKLEEGPMEHKVEEPIEHHSYFPSTAKFAKDFRKTAALGSVPSLCVLFKNFCMKECNCKVDLDKAHNLECYIDKCVELTWLMIVQDPPMTIEWLEKDAPMDKIKYKYYERKGHVVEICVWPALFLHDKGPMVSKGFVRPWREKK